MKFLKLAATLLALPLAAGAQHSLAMHNHSGTGSASACRAGDWNTEIQLFPDDQRGSLKHRVSTKVVAAQVFFDQGLTFFYGFDAQSAMRSFHMAFKLDPALAMAHWGVALAAGGDLNIPIDGDCMKLAVAESKLAYQMRGTASTGEQMYIDALTARYATPTGPGPDVSVRDPQQLGVNYMLRMRKVAAALAASDPDATSLFAYSLMNLRPWLWWTTDGVKSAEITEALAVLDAGLKRFPGHLGLNHIRIHAQEEGPVPQAATALPSADLLSRDAPFITPHLNHMPAHIFLLTGQWEKVVAANIKATNADQPWVAACPGQAPFPMACNQLLVGHYYSHDMLFLDVGLANQGLWPRVEEVSAQVEANVVKFVGTQPDLEHYLTTRTMMMVHFGKWAELARQDPPQTTMPAFTDPNYCGLLDHKLAAATWYFGQAMAHASLGQPSGDDVKGFGKAQGCVAAAGLGWGNNTAADILAIVHWRMLERIARTSNDLDAARTFALLAVESEDLLNYDEPPGWYVSSRETYGATLLLSKQYSQALDVFREDQARRPNGARSLFGIWKVLEAQGSGGAAKAREDFMKQWKSADLPKIEDM